MKLLAAFSLSFLLLVSAAHADPANVPAVAGITTAPPAVSLLTALITAGATLITAGGAFAGVVYAQRATPREKRKDERDALEQRLTTLRASLRAELTQLIEVIEDEIKYFDWKPKFTWFPIRDYFEIYRQNRDLIGMLDEREVELLTRTMHILEERMGYIARKSQMQKPEPAKLNDNSARAANETEILLKLGPPIGQNIRLDFKGDADRNDLRSNLDPILNAAKAARDALSIKSEAPKLRRPSKGQGPKKEEISRSPITARPAAAKESA